MHGVVRNSPDKDGKIDFDMRGRLVGGWFLKGLPMGTASAIPDAWPGHLAFVYNMTTPSFVRVAIGRILSMQGLYGVVQPAPDPSSVSTSTGKIGYNLTSPFDFPGILLGRLVVHIGADDTKRVESFPNLIADTASFDASAVCYAC